MRVNIVACTLGMGNRAAGDQFKFYSLVQNMNLCR